MHKAFSHEILTVDRRRMFARRHLSYFVHPVVKSFLPLTRRCSPLLLLAVALASSGAGCGGNDGTGLPPAVEAASLSIEQASFQLERGFHQPLTATARDKAGATISIPVVWRSSIERVATIDANGRLTALDTGVTIVTASTLGASAAPIGVRVVWQGAAKMAAYQFSAPGAATPQVTVPDSIRVLVTDRDGNPVPNARVRFAGSTGGSTLAPSIVTTKANGVAAAQWTLGAVWGPNVVNASVLSDDDTPLPFVDANPVSFSITTIPDLLTAVAGSDLQTGQILAALGTAPSVRLVDATGKPRPGIPVSFTPTAGGRVTTPTVSTGADGVASPGAWTLGDVPGDQSLIVKVESAVLTLHATGTGTPIHFMPAQVSAGGYATCAILTDANVQCWGEQPKVGDGTSSPRSKPTPTSGGVKLVSLRGSPTHFCGVSTDQSVYCWGTNALADPSGVTLNANVPTRLGSVLQWTQVSPGVEHNCAIASDQTVYCWGFNTYGQLGNGVDTLAHFAPAPVYGSFRFSRVSSGSFHTCALTTDDSAFCWGANVAGQLGDGTTTKRLAPTAVGGSISFQSIGTGESWSCGLSTAGRAYCWGSIPTVTTPQTTPKAYSTAPTFTSLSVGGAHACALTADGSAYCWGDNSGGQLGDSTTTNRAEPTPVLGGLKFQSISAGYQHTCARTSDGSVACWGLNRAGELGDATAASRLMPRYIVLGVTP
jgi:alpha-tubulin suppressor-like RCC1 family protein